MSGGILSEWINRQIKFFPVLPVRWRCWCCCPHTFSQAAVLTDGVCRQRGKNTYYCLYILLFFFSPQQIGHCSLQVELGRWNVQVLGSSCPFSPPLFHPKASKPSRSASVWEPQAGGALSPLWLPASHQHHTDPLLAPDWEMTKRGNLFTKNKVRFSQSLQDPSGFQS